MRYALLLLALAGCAAPDYRETSSLKLCTDYMTLPSMNVWHASRAAELRRRGEDCKAYAGVGMNRSQADQQFQDALRSAQPVPIPAPQPVTNTFLINGKVVTCTTTGTITNCF